MIACGSPVESIDDAIPTDGLVAFYPFNGGANDASGNGNHGSVVGATLDLDRFANSQSAYSFDGDNDYIQLSFYPVYGITDDFTYSVWVKHSSSQTVNSRILGFERTNAQEFCVARRTTSVIRYTLRDDDHYQTDCETSESYNDGQWHNVVVVRDASTDELSIYVDGNLTSVENDATQTAINTESSMWLAVGANNHSSGVCHYYQGSIDDIRIYDRVLNETEIQALYFEGD